MITWDGISVSIHNAMEDIQPAIKKRQTTILVIAAVFAVGIILFIRKK